MKPRAARRIAEQRAEQMPRELQNSIDSLAERAALWLLDATDTADNFAPRWEALERKLKRDLTKALCEVDV